MNKSCHLFSPFTLLRPIELPAKYISCFAGGPESRAWFRIRGAIPSHGNDFLTFALSFYILIFAFLIFLAGFQTKSQPRSLPIAKL